MDDSAWAFALAVNNSLSENGFDNGTEVERNLRSVNFSGALERVAFNGDREVVTEVDIFHVRGSDIIYVGHYNPLTGNSTVQWSLGRIPMDDFEHVVLLISLTFPIVTKKVSGI